MTRIAAPRVRGGPVPIAQHSPPLLNDIPRHRLAMLDVARSFPEAMPA